MADSTPTSTPDEVNTPAVEKTPDQVRADAIAEGIALTKANNPGWSGEGPWPLPQ